MADEDLDGMSLEQLEAEAAQIRKTLSPYMAAQGSTPAPSYDFGPIQQAKQSASLTEVLEPIIPTATRKEEYEQLPDWVRMPELRKFAMTTPAAVFGTMASGPEESAKILQAQFPNLGIRQDGRYLIFKSEDGNEYAWKPGLRFSDIARGGLAMAATLPVTLAAPAGVLGGAAAGLGGALMTEGLQAATGGSFDTGQVLAGGALGGLIQAAGNLATAIKRRVTGEAAEAAGGAAAQAAAQPAASATGAPAAGVSAAAGPAVGAPAAAPAAAAPAAAPVAAQAFDDLGATLGRAARGDAKAAAEFAAQVQPNPETLAAADRLGIRAYLQPDHVSTNQAAVELIQATKSVPGSALRQGEVEGLRKVGERAQQLITDLGGQLDRSAVDASVRGRLETTIADLETKASAAYAAVRKAIPGSTEASADNVLGFIEQQAADLGGAQNLPQWMKQIRAKLTPRKDGESVKYPTYALLDAVRKEVGDAARMAGPFKDADKGLAKKLYGLLSDDQIRAAADFGQDGALRAAQKLVAVRKGLEDDVASLFGRQTEATIVGSLLPRMDGAIRGLSQGDVSKFVSLVKALPPEMRQETVTSALATAFGKVSSERPIDFGTFTKWFEGLRNNKQAYAALMSSLKPEAKQGLQDLFQVSRGIANAARNRITTGRLQSVLGDVRASDPFIAKLFDLGAWALPGKTPRDVSGMIAAKLRGVNTPITKAADAFLASPEAALLMEGLARQAPIKPGLLQRVKESLSFRRLMDTAKVRLSDRQRWLESALRTTGNMAAQSGQSKPKEEE